eukprot:TRINITY_DN3078_c0_g5_i1.p1 TRINITY_DN3078_c0_g5~~TRINITY_DN3078_c0_g5_i1.p1  ORF type:complete len:544 (-),score=45.06 TRINITY_DN3078_c0_g5_i1:546-2099(-)
MSAIFDDPFPLGKDASSPVVFHPGLVVNTLNGASTSLPYVVMILGILIATITCIGLCSHCHLDPEQWSAGSGKDVREPRALPITVASLFSIILIIACTIPVMQGEGKYFELWREDINDMHRLTLSSIQASSSMLNVATAMSQEMSCIIKQGITDPLLQSAQGFGFSSESSVALFETGMARDFHGMVSVLNANLAAENSFELMFRKAENTTDVAQPITAVVLIAPPALMASMCLAILLYTLMFKLRLCQSHTMVVIADCLLERIGSVLTFVAIFVLSLSGAFQLQVAQNFSKFCSNVDPNVLAMFGSEEHSRSMTARFAKYYIAMKGSNPVDLSDLAATADLIHKRLGLMTVLAHLFGTRCAHPAHSISDVLSHLDKSVELFHDGVKNISQMTSASNIHPHYVRSVHVAFCSQMTEGLGYLSLQNITASCIVFPVVVLLFDHYLFRYAAHLRFQREQDSWMRKETESLVERTPASSESPRLNAGFFSCGLCSLSRKPAPRTTTNAAPAPVAYTRASEV